MRPARDESGRPYLDAPLFDLVRTLASSENARLGHIDPSRILFVAGAARRESSASVRPLTFGGDPLRDRSGEWLKPRICIRGVRMLYEVCLRPRFFLRARPGERVAIIAHELWHISPRFDGSLAEDRRHDRASAIDLKQEVEHITEAWRSSPASLSVMDALAFHGEVRLGAWLSRPPSRLPAASQVSRGFRIDYTESDLYDAIIEQGCA